LKASAKICGSGAFWVCLQGEKSRASISGDRSFSARRNVRVFSSENSHLFVWIQLRCFDWVQ
jgi:hypothetical protein